MFNVILGAEGIEEKTLSFDKDEITIGRLSSSDIYLKASNISKQHSRIVFREGRYFILDRKSTNGTFVNGNRVTVPISLKDEDKIYIGDFTLTFVMSTETAKAEAPQAETPAIKPPPIPANAKTEPPENDDSKPSETVAKDAETPAKDQTKSGLENEETPENEIPKDENIELENIEAETRLLLYTLAMDFEEFEDAETFIEYGLDDEELKQTITNKLIKEYKELDIKFSEARSNQIIDSVLKELLGFGPLEDYIFDDDFEEISINGPDSIVVKHNGVKEVTGEYFCSEETLFSMLVRLLDPFEVQLSDESVVVNAALPDFHVSALLHPFSALGSSVRIVKRPRVQESLESLNSKEILNEDMAMYLAASVEDGKTICVTGENQADRIKILGALGQTIPEVSRVALLDLGSTIEMPHEDLLVLETNYGDVLEGELALNTGDLIKNLKIMNVDKLLMADVDEISALDLLSSLECGLPSAIFSVYGKSCKDGLARLSRMIKLAGATNDELAETMIRANVDVILCVRSYKNGQKKIICMSELASADDGYDLKKQYYFDKETDESDELVGEFVKA